MSRAVVLHYFPYDDLSFTYRTNDARLVYLLLLPELDASGAFYATHGVSLEESIAFRTRLPPATVTDALRELVEHTFVVRNERALSVSDFQERQAEGTALLLSQGTVLGDTGTYSMAELPPPPGPPLRSGLPRSEDYVHPAISPMDRRLAAPIIPGETPEERRMRLRCLAQKNRRDAKRQGLARSDRPSVLASESEHMASPDGFKAVSKQPQSSLKAASKRPQSGFGRASTPRAREFRRFGNSGINGRTPGEFILIFRNARGGD